MSGSFPKLVGKWRIVSSTRPRGSGHEGDWSDALLEFTEDNQCIIEYLKGTLSRSRFLYSIKDDKIVLTPRVGKLGSTFELRFEIEAEDLITLFASDGHIEHLQRHFVEME